ncbi:hypothetical protein AOLI_G00277960 [Acnodon oligacanthus]
MSSLLHDSASVFDPQPLKTSLCPNVSFALGCFERPEGPQGPQQMFVETVPTSKGPGNYGLHSQNVHLKISTLCTELGNQANDTQFQSDWDVSQRDVRNTPLSSSDNVL